MHNDDPTPLALTMGEPAGIGPEIALKVWQKSHRSSDMPRLVVFGDGDVFDACAHQMNLPVTMRRRAKIGEYDPELTDELQIVQTDAPATSGRPGRASPADGAAIIESIEKAVAAVVAGAVRAVVTNPIHKKNLYDGGFGFPGHTEFLASLADRHFGSKHRSVMMLAGPELRTVPATIHLPLQAVSAALTINDLVDIGEITLSGLSTRFNLPAPRLAVTGLNPHAGEGGAMGREEIDIISPAIATLQARGHRVSGPHPADTLFHPAARQNYDAVLTMYHDQALIPAKMLAFDQAVNVTLGLPFVRTSPDHGTAFDIAGQSCASPDALFHAINLAARLTRTGEQEFAKNSL